MRNFAQQLANSSDSIFKGIDSDDLEALVGTMERRIYQEGDVIFEQDDEGDAMYLIVSGRICIYLRNAEGDAILFRCYEQYQTVGELALLDGRPRSALAVAARATNLTALLPIELLILHRQDFLSFLEERPSVGLAMMRDLTDRVRYSTVYLEHVMDAINWMVQGNYERALQEVTISSDDDQIQNMIAKFLQMVENVRVRAPRSDPFAGKPAT